MGRRSGTLQLIGLLVVAVLLATACSSGDGSSLAQLPGGAEQADTPSPMPAVEPAITGTAEASTPTSPPTTPDTSAAVPREPTATPTQTPETRQPGEDETDRPATSGLALTSEPLDQALANSTIESADCPPGAQNEAITCFLAQVPTNAHEPGNADHVTLQIAKVDNGDTAGVGPVAFLQGGPGVGSVSTAERFVGVAYDLVFVDQRGTGGSFPSLRCDEVSALWVAARTGAPDGSDDAVRSAYADCATRLRAEGIDLNAFNTEAAADDMALVRELLGIESWNLWGISYGTRLGLTILRDHPEGVRAAVLDSVLPFEVDFFAGVPINGWRSFVALDAACDASSCTDDHGDFLTELGDLARELDAEPARVAITRPVSGEQLEMVVDGAELLNMVFSQMYSASRFVSLPRQVSRARFGGIEEITVGWASRRDPESFDLSLGLYYATWCREEFPFHNPLADEDALLEAETQLGVAFGDALEADGVGEICASFNVAPSPAIDDQPITSTVPVVVFAGAFDPITPPSWSRLVADQLPRSFYFEFPDHGHGMTTRCAGEIQLAFLQEPSVEPDSTCLAEATAPPFD